MKKGYDEGIAIKNGRKSSIDCILRSVSGKGVASTPHYHDYVELLYGTDCDMEVQINDKVFNFCTDDLIIINPRETHALYSNSKKSDYIVIKFMLEILQYEGEMSSEMIYFFPVLHSSPNEGHIIKNATQYSKNISNIVHNIYNEWITEDFGYELAARSGIINLFLQIVRCWNMENKYKNIIIGSDETAKVIYTAAEYCKTHYSNITAKKLADKSSMSYSYFCRCFKRIIGQSFSQYINDVRINHANRMLLTTSASMTKIAADTGFSSTSHFAQKFKEKTGVSPLSYKKEFKKKYGNDVQQHND